MSSAEYSCKPFKPIFLHTGKLCGPRSVTLFAKMTFKSHKQMTKQTTNVVMGALRVKGVGGGGGGLDSVEFRPVFTKEATSVTCFAFLHHKPLLERVYSKRKEFAPKGSTFFPFRVDPIFRREAKTVLSYLPWKGIHNPESRNQCVYDYDRRMLPA